MARRNIIRTALENMAANGVPTARATRDLDVGTHAFLSHMESEILEDLIARGGATCRFFEGVYGAGKSHLLRLIADLGLERGMAVAWTDLSQSLALEDWRLITQHVLQNMEARIGDETVRSLPSILQALQRSGQANMAALQSATLSHPGFQRAMLYAVQDHDWDSEAWSTLRLFLLGERVLVSTLKRQGIRNVKDSLTTRNAEQALGTVVAGLHHLGLPGTMLLFDENERTLGTQRLTTKISISANTIRRMIDGCTTGNLVGTLAVFAVLPGFLDACNSIYPALGQRLNMPRGEEHQPAWRWPVLPVNAVSTARTPEIFLEQAINLLVGEVVEAGGSIDGLHEEMRAEGLAVLEDHAGMGHRRTLMKLLASLALARMNRREAL